MTLTIVVVLITGFGVKGEKNRKQETEWMSKRIRRKQSKQKKSKRGDEKKEKGGKSPNKRRIKAKE